jgi:hypothetical protein
MLRRIATNGAVFVGSIVVVIFLGEFVVFRFLWKASDMPRNVYTGGVIRYVPNQTGVVRIRNEVRARYTINAQGWNSAHPTYDIPQSPDRPRIAIVGDSYVEAFQVDSDRSAAEHLEACLDAEVFRFGLSGSPLSQYLYMIRQEVVRYRPQIVIVLLIHNDFVESYRLRIGRYTESFMRFEIDDGAITEIPPAPYDPPRLLWLRGSAWYRFVVDRMQLPIRNLKEFVLRSGRSDYVANVPASMLGEEWDNIERVTRYFFDELVAAGEQWDFLPVVAVDGVRQLIYSPGEASEQEAEAIRVNELCRRVGAERGVKVVDLQDAFARDFAERGVRFEYVHDGHWNEVGHEVAAKTLCEALAAAVRDKR